jgi:DNA mismatch endonuclease (patch repair protein)
MSQIRSSGNKSTEVRFLRILRRNGISGWRRRYDLFGQPDFVFASNRVAVFIDGCFWHGCPRHGQQPSQNAEYWRQKLIRNRQRDIEVATYLRKRGWKVFRVWEHALNNESALLRRLERALFVNERAQFVSKSNQSFTERAVDFGAVGEPVAIGVDDKSAEASFPFSP